MINLAPEWFLREDILIGIFSLIVLGIFTIFAVKNYRINKNRNLLYLGLGFGLIALAQLGLILTKAVIYYNTPVTTSIGVTIIESGVISSVDVLYGLSFFFYRMFTLLGFYVIYRLPQEKKFVGSDLALVTFFILVSAFISSELFYIFHLTALLLLILIVNSYYQVYKKNKFINTKILLVAFSMLALAQLLFVLSSFEVLFVVGSAIELISYTILLGLIVRIMKHGKEKKPYGDNIRHVGNHSRKKRKH